MGRTRDRLVPVGVAVVCALRCEARPLIRRLGLISAAGTWYSDDVALRVSGVGEECAAQTVGRLAASADDATCWLNLGCAGGRGPIGELVVAHRVSSDESDDCWYPQFPFPVAEPTVEVHSVRRPETAYLDSGTVYDMEAAGFYVPAVASASLERVHVLKVRVDGPERPLERLSADAIGAAIEARVESIAAWIDRLATLARSVRARRPEAGLVDAFLERWRFTVSQEVQLQRLLGRMHALSLPIPAVAEMDGVDSRVILDRLARTVDAGLAAADGAVEAAE